MPIRILSPDVASKIAAGEVIERPASVVKELIENSLDAGATQISVEAMDGGVRLMRVVDNGAGIPPEEVETAFQRFATSKVSSAEDLDGISTLGFRGEALPSIVAVSEVTIVTRSRDEMSGIFLSLKDGAVFEKAQRGAPTGTAITVRNLFRSFPARLKFLKSSNTENGHISNLVAQYSLAYPEVRFTLNIDGRVSFRSPGSGDLREALGAVYGTDTAKALLEIAADQAREDALPVKVNGCVSPPSVSRANRSYQSFFVNRRWIQSRMLTFALEEAYKGLLITGKHPIVVINLTLPPQDLDVNVHPTKSEVKFRHERDVFSAVQKAVRATILAQATIPILETPAASAATPAQQPQPIRFIEASPQRVDPVPLTQPVAQALPSAAEPTVVSLPILRVMGQMANSYIIAEGPDGMYLIDQHAAHERILFEKVKAQKSQQAVEVQGLLQPAPVELTVRQQELLESRMEVLAEYGFAIEHFGERTYMVRSLPAIFNGQDAAQSLIGIISELERGKTDDFREEVAASMACHGAVKAGQPLSLDEMRDLLRQLELTSQPRNCPHGRPTMVHISAAQVEKGFGRR